MFLYTDNKLWKREIREAIPKRQHQRNGSRRHPFGHSSWSFNNLKSYNLKKKSLLKTQTHLRDLHIEKSERLASGREQKEVEKEKTWDEPGIEPYSPELTMGFIIEKGGINLQLVLPSTERSKKIQWAFMQGWPLLAAAEPSDMRKDKAQRCGHSCLAGNLAAFLHPTKAHLPSSFLLGYRHIICKLEN